jgi:hypothetical protein
MLAIVYYLARARMLIGGRATAQKSSALKECNSVPGVDQRARG